MLRRNYFVAVATFFLATAAWAAPCANAVFNVYDVNGFTCTVGPLTFSNFDLGNASDLGNTDLDVTVTSAANSVTLTFGFSPGGNGPFMDAAVGGTNRIEVEIDYSIAIAGVQRLTGASINMNTTTALAGTSTMNDDLTWAGNGSATMNLFKQTGFGLAGNNTAVLPNLVTMDADKSAIANANNGANGSEADIMSISNTVTYNPEPAGMLLVICGLAGIIFQRKRLTSR